MSNLFNPCSVVYSTCGNSKFKMNIAPFFSSKIVRNTIYSFIEIGIPAILVLITTPFLLSGMGIESYGLWNVSIAYLGLIGVVDVGIGATTTKFVAEFNENQEIKHLSEIMTMSFILSVSLGTVFTLILYLLSPWFASYFMSPKIPTDQILLIFQVGIFGLFPMMLENIGLAIPRGLQEYKIITILLVSKKILTILYAVWIVLKKGDVFQIVMGTVVIIWVFAIISLSIAYGKAKKIGARIKFSLKTFRMIIKFTFFMGATGAGIKIFTLLDRVVVAQVLGFSDTAYYTIATGIANKFSAFASAATQALFPAFSSWNVTKDKQTIWKKLVTATLLVGISAIVPGVIVLIYSKTLVFWWLGEQNGNAILQPMRILIFIYMAKTISAPSYQAANGLGFPWVTTIAVATASLGTIGLIVVLGNVYGLVGASWANIASWSLFGIIFFLYKILKSREADNVLTREGFDI